MDLGLKDKVAFVSGSSKGMGKAAATIFAEEGAKVVTTGRNQETVSAAVEEIKGATGNTEIMGIAVDLITKEGVQSAVSQVVERWGKVDIAVSNVYGPASQGKAFESVSEEEWFRAYQQQVMHVVYLTSCVIPVMMNNRLGCLINISSTTSKEPPKELSMITGCTVRPAVVGLQKSLANESAEYGITVNNILPGAIATERLKNEQERLNESNRQRAKEMGSSPDEIPAGPWAQIPMKRLGEPREIGSVISFLASDQASYISGVTLQVDGGRMRSLF
jgi:3-oxoacyl-[acyl-carrier protein] reductase